MIELFDHQKDALKQTDNHNKCAYYLDMGLGKTFVGSEKMVQCGNRVNLIVCQKSKVNDWLDHVFNHYEDFECYDLTKKDEMFIFSLRSNDEYEAEFYEGNPICGVINYDLAFRRKELLNLKDFTLMLDESSLVQNQNAKRSKFIMQLNYKNLILLSGTPTGGKYENLWSQLNMLGYNLSEKAFYNMYVNYHYEDDEGFPVRIIDGYKNVDRLKRKMSKLGCVFMKSDEVFDLPKQNFINVRVNPSKEYRKFRKDCICTVDKVELVGDSIFAKMLYERQLCGQYSKMKLEAFVDLLESTSDRLIVFYNFNDELNKLKEITREYTDHISEINGNFKDLTAYENYSDSVTFIQYQAGAMGLNLQKANKIVYFTPPLSSELFEQSKKRIHRIGQDQPCFYYQLVCKNSIEEKIYRTLAMRRDYTDALFEKGE